LSNPPRIFLLTTLTLLSAGQSAWGQQAPAADTSAPAAAASTKTDELETITVNGVRKGDLIMPTTVTSTSAFGLDLGVLDTPRNNTVLSKTQLEALNVQNPQGFSFLTASSYSDASFGVPNVPRIRGQYADVFFNGMRDSFTSNGYGAPISFNSIDQMDIIKGPASVQAGPGAGVGGAIDITTKLPNASKFTGSVSLELDTLEKRRFNVDVGGPAGQNLSYRLSYTGDLSGSYYNGMYFHQESLYGVVVANITPKYTVQFNTEYVDARYRENDGINRVNQQLIDNGTYLTGVPSVPIASYLTPVTLGNPVQLSREVIIDQPPGTSARAARYNAQLIQTYELADNVTLVNNTFYNFINRYNVIPDYYADTAQASYTIENKTDVKVKFATPFSGLLMNHSVDAGASIRYAHVDTIQNFAAETVSVFDLTGNPTSWDVTNLQAGAGAFPYVAAFGAHLWGVPARGVPFVGYLNSTINSNLTDVAAFVEHRIEFTPTMSVLYGLRGDAVHLIESDPLGGPGYFNGYGPAPLPATESTPWYGLANGNVSPVFRPTPWMSTYLTYNFAQYVLPTGNDGAVGTFGVNPTTQLRQNTHLLEAGSKFDLLDKSLFLSAAIYEQTRSVSTGPGTDSSTAHIKGLELEANYQPGPRLFATASYSFMRTVLDTNSTFYNFPAQPGLNYDGGGTVAAFAPGQTFNDPGIPRHLFNFLVNYKDPSGFGAQANLQVIGKVETTQSGQLDLNQTLNNLINNTGGALTSLNGVVPQSVLNNGGYYQSPTIPWQYTINTAAFYKYNNYEFRFSIFNLTDRRNVTNDIPFYGNDFITVNPPRSYAISVKYKFN